MRMPKLIALYIRSVVIGFAVAGLFVALLLWLDVGGLGGLVWRAEQQVLAVAMLVTFHGIVFAGVQFAYAIMSMAEPLEPPQRGRKAPVRRAEPSLVPVVRGRPGRGAGRG
jgi:hypothetical protein